MIYAHLVERKKSRLLKSSNKPDGKKVLLLQFILHGFDTGPGFAAFFTLAAIFRQT